MSLKTIFENIRTLGPPLALHINVNVQRAVSVALHHGRCSWVSGWSKSLRNGFGSELTQTVITGEQCQKTMDAIGPKKERVQNAKAMSWIMPQQHPCVRADPNQRHKTKRQLDKRRTEANERNHRD